MKEFEGFMTREGVLLILAKEHRINSYNDAYYKELDEMTNYDEFSINIVEVKEQMTNIVLIGKIISFSKLLEFTQKDSTVGKVSSFIMADSSGSIKVILWEENAHLIERELFKEGELVRVIGGYSKKGIDDCLEVHVGKKGRIIIVPTDISTKLREHLATISEHPIFEEP
jgi:ssDNA-binding replication factor A large subunit